MTTYYTFIPQAGTPQNFQVTLGGVEYDMTLRYRNVPNGGASLLGWVLDIADDTGNPLISGIPLVTGCDLLAQYPDFGFGGQLVVATTGDPDAVPTFDNLGDESEVYWVTAS